MPDADRPPAIPISAVHLGEDVERLVVDVLRSGMIAQGPMVRELEDAFACMHRVDHVVAVNNGTTALVAALRAAGIGPGDEVVTSPFTFVATLNAILEVGATAQFADISSDDFNVSPRSIEAAITSRTRALLPVHLYGQAADMAAISGLVEQHDLALIEDAAQAHGATFDGRHVGSWGIGCFSLYATKNLTSGEGGLVTTNDATIADRLRVMRNQGMRARYQYEMVGSNLRMTDLQAAVCIPQLRRYDASVARRERHAASLTAGLSEVRGIRTPAVMPRRNHVWHQYTILVTDAAAIDRDELAARLAQRGIGTGVYYPRVAFDYDCFADHPRVAAADVPVARRVAETCLSLPVHPALSDDDVARIVDAVATAMHP